MNYEAFIHCQLMTVSVIDVNRVGWPSPTIYTIIFSCQLMQNPPTWRHRDRGHVDKKSRFYPVKISEYHERAWFKFPASWINGHFLPYLLTTVLKKCLMDCLYRISTNVVFHIFGMKLESLVLRLYGIQVSFFSHQLWVFSFLYFDIEISSNQEFFWH